MTKTAFNAIDIGWRRGNDSKPNRIAILGGGITGLSAAYFASRRFPSASITLFEESARLGGLIESVPVKLGHGSTLICETGPRTLRPNNPRAIATFELIHNLNLVSSLLTVAKSSSINSKRYILSTEGRLVPIPWGNIAQHPTHVPVVLWQLCREPMFSGIINGLMRDVFLARRPDVLHDESVAEFVQRRWGGAVADNIVSAAVHGLYAGDIDTLSARSVMPICELWDMEKVAERRRKQEKGLASVGGVTAELLRVACKGVDARGMSTRGATILGEHQRDWIQSLRDSAVGDAQRALHGVSVFGFRHGVGQLPAALEESLRRTENVELNLGAAVTGIAKNQGGIDITTRLGSRPQHFTHAISALPLNQLLSCLGKRSRCPSLLETSVTVLSVTLCYAALGLNHPYRGFGYLIPRSVPLSVNPHRALGVVFDTDAMPGQDCGTGTGGVGTKISVLFGGHWWNGKSDDGYPDQREAVRMAKAVLKSHLGIAQQPAMAVVKLCRRSIPQFHVGHRDRMGDLHRKLLQEFEGQLRVAGKSYLGIGVHDCIFSARSVVEGLETDGLSGLEVLEH